MYQVTYGACCIDDLSAQALGADFLVHYGHSCLVPISVTCIKTLYVFVNIGFDTDHVRCFCMAHFFVGRVNRRPHSRPCSLQQLVATIKANFSPDTKLAVLGTIQFAAAIHTVRAQLLDFITDCYIPQVRAVVALVVCSVGLRAKTS